MNRILIARWVAGSALSACLLAACGGGKPVKRDPAVDAITHYRTAQAYLNAQRIQEAVREMEQAVALAPSDGQMQNFLGQVYFVAGRYPQAEASFRKALEIDSYLTDAYNNLGALYDRTGRKTEAEESFRKALADPAYRTPEKVHLNLGLLYGSLGRNEDAIRELRKAVEIDPKFHQAHYELAARLEDVGNLQEAVREYEVAAVSYRQSGEYHYRLGFAYLRLGDKAKAAEHLRQVIAISPGSENAARADELLRTVR